VKHEVVSRLAVLTLTIGVAAAACAVPRQGEPTTVAPSPSSAAPAPSTSTATSSSTTTTAPPGGSLWPTLALRRDGVYAQNGTLAFHFGEATLAEWEQFLGPPDQVVSHLPVPGTTRCVDEHGRERPYLDANQTVRWGDLRVVFGDHRVMVGYLYGPRFDGRPDARFHSVTIGDRIGDLLRARLIDVLPMRNPTYGFPFREVDDDLGVHGFASGTTEEATVEAVFSGYQCFGLAR
jgi:hypothetical protein